MNSTALCRSGKIKLPDYVDYAKTAKHKELAPYDKDWYYIRAGMYIIIHACVCSIKVSLLCQLL